MVSLKACINFSYEILNLQFFLVKIYIFYITKYTFLILFIIKSRKFAYILYMISTNVALINTFLTSIQIQRSFLQYVAL